jgi:hypothetical protein
MSLLHPFGRFAHTENRWIVSSTVKPASKALAAAVLD